MKILVAYDGSPQSEHALSEATLIAEKFAGSVIVLKVQLPSGEKENTDEQNIRNELNGRMKGFEGRYEVVFKENRDISGTILKIAGEGGFDLIAMGRRGTSSLSTRLMGSVSRRVVSEAQCDVLVTK